MGDLVVRAWKRHGQDRLYITDSLTSQKVGFYDRTTGKINLSDASRETEALTALRPFLATGAPAHVNGLQVDLPLEDDLTANRPGAAAAEQAAALGPQGFQRFAARLLKIRTEATSWEVGAAGERMVGQRLAKLSRGGWQILHAVRLRSGADIDHVVIGPGGVFTVNTKHHADAKIRIGDRLVWVNGSQKQYLRNSAHEAQSAAQRLSAACRIPVQVTPVLAFVRAAEIKIGSSAGSVVVLHGERIDQYFERLPRTLTATEQDRIFSVARRPEIWLA